MSMNIFNCMNGEAVLVNDPMDSRTLEQNCFSHCCGNCRFTRCETRAVSNESNDTFLPTPTCVAVNQMNSDRDSNHCCCNRCRNRRCCNRCCRREWFF